jgi:hypothetical protein
VVGGYAIRRLISREDEPLSARRRQARHPAELKPRLIQGAAWLFGLALLAWLLLAGVYGLSQA